ncbi:MAG: hypothetical protein ABH952_02185 [Candidatus Omnitrophota bacterium]
MKDKNKTALLPFFVTIFIITGCALGYIHAEVMTIKLSYEISEKQHRLSLLLDQNRYLQYNTIALKSPGFLEKMLVEKDIDLDFVTSHKMIKVAQVGAGNSKNKQGALTKKWWSFLIVRSQAQANTVE